MGAGAVNAGRGRRATRLPGLTKSPRRHGKWQGVPRPSTGEQPREYRRGPRGLRFLAGAHNQPHRGRTMPYELSTHEALIYVMVTMSAVDRNMGDEELARIGSIVNDLPAFHGFDADGLIAIAQTCGERLSAESGLDTVLASIAQALPKRMHETAYALAVEVAAADLEIRQEELRFLAMLRDRLHLDKLIVAALERGARARYQTA
ncbi:MAG: hypothetical protein GC150_14070 [Rhizobiales bacterium]|nr:hypothetical protein [Hyphomicrobiales bacterium]